MKELSKPMTELPSLEKDKLNNASNRQNTLSLTNKVIFQKRDTEIINKKFLTKVVLKDVNKESICRRHLTEKSLDEHLIENDRKKVRQNKETEICSYSPIILLQRHQSPCTKELSRKGINDGNMNVIFFNQFEWTDSMIEVL